MLKWRVLDFYFFTEINVFVITQSKVPKKGTVEYRYRISGTDTATGSNVNATQPYTLGGSLVWLITIMTSYNHLVNVPGLHQSDEVLLHVWQ